MTLEFHALDDSGSLRDKKVFLSASIPDPERWAGDFAPLEITDAVVALAKAVIAAGGHLVTAAHPTIAPLLLYVAAEMDGVKDRITVYQSELFGEMLPTATRRFEADGIGTLIWTPATEGDRPQLGHCDASLRVMRETMLSQSQPSAAVFIGGMEGIHHEFDLYRELVPGRPVYAAGAPGGAARSLAARSDVEMQDVLASGTVYPALWRAVCADIARGACQVG